jgi:hypothetical protein
VDYLENFSPYLHEKLSISEELTWGEFKRVLERENSPFKTTREKFENDLDYLLMLIDNLSKENTSTAETTVCILQEFPSQYAYLRSRFSPFLQST